MTTAPIEAGSTYAYSNHSSQAASHHRALAGLFDEVSAARTDALLNLSGARCLEVAAGGGGFARWLATRVGTEGSVVATDIAPHHVPAHPRLRVLAHDHTEPLPESIGTFDFIHARLILNHLPCRRRVVTELVSALAPQGVILVEDLDPVPADQIVAYAPTAGAASLLGRFQQAHGAVLRRHGTDPNWSREAHGALIEEGLAEVHTTVHATSWPGGSPGSQLLAAGLGQLRSEMVAAHLLDEGELDRVHAMLNDPEIVLHGHRLVSTSARRRTDRTVVAS